MGNQPIQPQGLLGPLLPRTFDEALLAHAERLWKAECDNAERVTKERHLLLTILVAFLGFGLFKIEWIQAVLSKLRVNQDWAVASEIILALLLATATILFVIALFSLAHLPKAKTASERLILEKSAYATPLISNELQRRAVFLATLEAASSLMEKNQRMRSRQSRAWRLFLFGVAVVAMVILLYTSLRFVSILSGSDHGTVNTSQPV